jgi:hypothetical protein
MDLMDRGNLAAAVRHSSMFINGAGALDAVSIPKSTQVPLCSIWLRNTVWFRPQPAVSATRMGMQASEAGAEAGNAFGIAVGLRTGPVVLLGWKCS